MGDERLARLLKKARRLPLTPGVYIMHDSSGKIIYIGKAKALKNRVSQYFGTQEHHTEKVRRMVENVDDFEYILCADEFEALILECSLIKQHSPKYNILLKDDKGFHYIRVTPEPWPTIKAVKQLADDGARYIGPFNSGYNVTQSVDAALKAFKLPQCSKTGRDMGKAHGRPCLNYHIGLCSAPCCAKISRADYSEAVEGALKFLTDGSASAISEMTAEMERAAEALEFEKAARLRDRIDALKGIAKKQQVIEISVREQDVIAIAQSPDRACFEVFNFRAGRLCDREHFLVDRVDNAPAARAEFITRYYSMSREVPPIIAVDGEFDDAELLADWLSERRGKKVSLTVPQRGEQKRIVDMCRSNAAEYLAEKSGRTGRDTAALDELARLLGLRKPPEFIESYDISHTGGDETVGGMIVYRNGTPYRAGYRKFKINDFTNDDCASMCEVVSRRFDEYEKGERDNYFSRMPDLLLLDGGRGQVHAVEALLRSRGISVPVFGMVKDDRHHTRAITSDGDEIGIKATRSAYNLVYSIQEEVHRFAIGYHRRRRKKKMLGSSLTRIEGIGETRAKALMAHFGTISAIAEADLDDLMQVAGMTAPAAESVYNYFRAQRDGGQAGNDRIKTAE